MTEENQSSTVKVFGVGCIYFGLDGSGDFPGRPEYVSSLDDNLKKIDSISNIKFHGFENSKYGSFSSYKKNDGTNIVPMFYLCRFSFDIYLPFRVQDEIHERCDVELIHVDFIYGYDSPLMIVSYDWPSEEGDATPSGVIVVLRKYLSKKIAGDMVCDCLGPSPFHANFVVVEDQSVETPYAVNTSPVRRGYSLIELRIPPGMPLLQAINRSDLDGQISKFYRLSELRVRMQHEHLLIAQSAQNLLDEHNQKFLHKIKSWWEKAKIVNSLNKSIFQEIILRMEMNNAISDSDSSGISGTHTPLDSYFSRFRFLAKEDSWSKFSDVAKFFEERRQKVIGNTMAISAGIVGGIIGSVATYLLTKF